MKQNTKSWTDKVDRSRWSHDMRQLVASESDREQWVDEDTGLDCLMVRQNHGVWCGYVGVTPAHPFHHRGYEELYNMGAEINVHGGLTFADSCSNRFDAEGCPIGVCHVQEAAAPDDVWWFGFDCAHGGDVMPATTRLCAPPLFWDCGSEVYRDQAYVEREVTWLAKQLAELAK